MSDDFLSRLRWLLGDRKISPWGASLGLSRGLLSRITAGHVPGPDALALIARTENVSLSWLLTGDGPPYRVAHMPSDEDMAEELGALTQDEDWKVYLLTSAGPQVVVLTLPAAVQVGDDWVRYTAVEVLHGPVGPRTAKLLGDLAERDRYWHAACDVATATEIARQGIGTWQLTGQGGLLREAQPAHHIAAETPATYAAPSRDEQLLVERFRQLTPANKEHAAALMTALAKAGDLVPGARDTACKSRP